LKLLTNKKLEDKLLLNKINIPIPNDNYNAYLRDADREI